MDNICIYIWCVWKTLSLGRQIPIGQLTKLFNKTLVERKISKTRRKSCVIGKGDVQTTGMWELWKDKTYQSQHRIITY